MARRRDPQSMVPQGQYNAVKSPTTVKQAFDKAVRALRSPKRGDGATNDVTGLDWPAGKQRDRLGDLVPGQRRNELSKGKKKT